MTPPPSRVADASNHTDDRGVSRRRFLGGLAAGGAGGVALPRAARAQESPVVRMGNNYFDPIGRAVEPGTTVRFEIAAGVHSATAYPDRIPAGASTFDTGVIDSGGVEVTLETPGTYDYYCIPHKGVGMVGRLVVGTPGGPAEERPIPDGSVPDSGTIVDRGTVASIADGDGGGNGGGSGGRGMTGPGMGPGMMDGRSGGWWNGLPVVGGVLGAIGVAAGTLYWASRRTSAGADAADPALATLERRYARGEIDDATYRRRRKRLERETAVERDD